jgi:hypothetical protein
VLWHSTPTSSIRDIGAFNDRTLTIVRTDVGRELTDPMARDGWTQTGPGDDDAGAIALMHKLATNLRKPSVVSTVQT